MRKNEFEDKMLNKIEKIDEGLALNFLKLLFRPAVKRALKSIKQDQPEMHTTIDALEHYDDEMKMLIKRWKKDRKSKDSEKAENAERWLRIFGIK